MSEQRSEDEDGRAERQVTVGHRADDDEVAVTLPTVQLLTGRGFVTGKSGSGKSNTASVLAEELLERQFPLLIVDTDGEYYGLKEQYELLHAGADDQCDIQVSPEHAERLATLALEQNVPIILDVSGYLDEDVASRLIRETARHLFAKEKKLKKPFLLVVEEVHEYIPEGGGMDETGKMLIKVGKRGRKHGLGIVGISQRPADVKKDFITQANWLVWHRLTWENDTKVVKRIVGGEYGDAVSDLGDGEGFVQTDWTEHDVRRVQFRRKRTFDAGATPGLDDFERPELKSVSDTLVDDLEDISERQQEEESRVAELERQLAEKEQTIADLEEELDGARDVSDAARRLANALNSDEPLSDLEQRIVDKDEEINRLRSTVTDLESQLAERENRIEELEGENDRLRSWLESDLSVDGDGARLSDAAVAGEETDDALNGDALPDETDTSGTDTGSEDEADLPGGFETDDSVATDGDDATTEPTVADAVTGGDGDDSGSDGERSSGSSGDATGEADHAQSTGGATRPTLTTDDIPGEWPDEVRARASSGSDGRRDSTDETDGDDTATAAGAAGDGPADDPAADDAPVDIATDDVVAASVPDEAGEGLSATLSALGEYGYALDSPLDLATTPPVSDEIATAGRHSQCSKEETWQLVTALAEAGPLSVAEATSQVLASRIAVQGLLSEMRSASLVRRTDDGAYALDYRAMAERIERYEVRRAEMDPLDREWPGAGE